MKLSLAMVVACVASVATTFAAEQAWEVRGTVVAIKPGDPEVVVLQLAGGGTIEVPLAALSAAGQSAARKQAAENAASASADGAAGDVLTVRGPFGRPVRVSVPESIKDVEGDAIRCRTAAEATDVYRLFLAGDRPTPAQRTAAEARQREWAAMAEKGVVRLGDRWVDAEQARGAADEAAKTVEHALELLRVGNGNLAAEELRKASRVDPESGRANFVMGLGYACVEKNFSKAADEFVAVAHREPENGAALNNLAVSEVQARRYGPTTEHFRAAMGAATDLMPVVENVAWAVKLAGDAKVSPKLAKNRMPDRTVEDLNALYRTLTQDLKLKPTATISTPRFLGPDGVPCTASSQADVAKHMSDAGSAPFGVRRSLGFVVAPGHVVCPRGAIAGPDGSVLGDVVVELPTARGQRLAATVIAAPEDGGMALLKCEGLAVEPLPLAATMPSLSAIVAVDRAGDSWLTGKPPAAARGKVLTPAIQVQARGRFVHTAVVARGPGGGPILDDGGRVVGMVAATPRTDDSGNAAGFGIPVERIWQVIKDHLPDVEAVANAPNEGEAAAVERRAVAGTVVVAASRSKPGNGAPSP